MSRIASIEALKIAVTEAELRLGEEIHRMFYPGRQILYQDSFCYTEDRSNWTIVEVVGPHDRTKITLRKRLTRGGEPTYDDFIVDGTSWRLALKDNCEICDGSKGGVPGNENVINGVIVCDHCHADQLKRGKAHPVEVNIADEPRLQAALKKNDNI